MDNDQLHQFCLIMETGTISEAARLLRRTPGAISRSMKKLGDEVGFPLFHQSGRKILPSEQAQQFYLLAAQNLAQMKSGITRIGQLQKITSQIRIASFEVFTTYLLNELIQNEFKEDEFLVFEKIPGKIEQSVLAGETDYGITYAPVTHPDLTFLRVTAFQMSLFHTADRFNKFDFPDIPFAVPTTPLGVNLANIDALDGWPRTAPQRFIKYRFELLESAIQACQNGLCAVFMPEFIAILANKRSAKSHQLTRLQIPEKIPQVKFQVFLTMRKNFAEDRRAKVIAKNLRRVCSQ